VLGFNSTQTYHIYTKNIDMRKGFDGLSGIVTNELEKNPRDGAVYIFFNGPRDKVKVLLWDKDGYVIYAKRLEKGRFEKVIVKEDAKTIELEYKFIVMLMSGLSLIGAKQKPRYLLT
jgi:transposase